MIDHDYTMDSELYKKFYDISISKENKVKKLKMLIILGIDVNINYHFPKGVKHQRYKAIENCCENGNLDHVKILVENGAHITVCAIKLAILNGHNDIVKYLLKNHIGLGLYDHKHELLYAACASNNLQAVKYLIEESTIDYDVLTYIPLEYKEIKKHILEYLDEKNIKLCYSLRKMK